MCINSFDVNRVLVDPGSVADLLHLPAFKQMRVPLDHLSSAGRVLSGFNGATTLTVEDIAFSRLLGPDRSFYRVIRAFKFDQLDVIHAGPDRSFYCTIRAFKFNQLGFIHAGPNRSFYRAIRAFAFDQLDVIYAGLDMSFYCIIRARGTEPGGPVG